MTYIGADSPSDRHFALKSGTLVSIGHLVYPELVVDEFNGIGQTVPESGVAGPIDELVVPHEQLLLAAFALVATHIVQPPVVTRECSFHALPLRDVVRVRTDASLQVLQVGLAILLLPFLVGLARLEGEAACFRGISSLLLL